MSGIDDTKMIGKTFVDTEDGRVYDNGRFIGFGILDKESNKIHMTHSVEGKTLLTRKVINLDK